MTNGRNQDDACQEELGKVKKQTDQQQYEIKQANKIIKAKHQTQQGNSKDKGVPSEDRLPRMAQMYQLNLKSTKDMRS